MYMSSRCTNDGVMALDVTFKLGTDIDKAQVLVQNRVAVAESRLPEETNARELRPRRSRPVSCWQSTY